MHKEIEAKGWRQGSVLLVEKNDALYEKQHLIEGLYVLISQSCDIVHEDFKNEPIVELLHIKEIEQAKYDGNYTCGKNPRTLHFENQKKY